MAKLIPWAEFEEEYAQHFSEDMGAPAKTFRMALGALIIKEQLGTSDRETVEQIRENPYLQYFLGLKAYTNEAPFDDSMFVHFRQKIGVDLVNKLNRQMVRKNREDDSVQPEKENPESKDGSESKNQGKLILDATVAPGDITYPNDLGILNQARKQTERIIDSLYEPLRGKLQLKPRTYRQLARKDYLLVAKCRKPLRKRLKICHQKTTSIYPKELISY